MEAKDISIFSELVDTEKEQIEMERQAALGLLFENAENAHNALRANSEPVLDQEYEEYGNEIYRTSRLTPQGVPLVAEKLPEGTTITVTKSVCEVFPSRAQMPDEVNWEGSSSFRINVSGDDLNQDIAFIDSVEASDGSVAYECSFDEGPGNTSDTMFKYTVAELDTVFDSIRADLA